MPGMAAPPHDRDLQESSDLLLKIYLWKTWKEIFLRVHLFEADWNLYW